MRTTSRHTRLVAALSAVVVTSVAGAVAVAADAADSASVIGPHVAGHVLVHFSSDATPADQAALEHANGATRIGTIADLGVDVLSVPVGSEGRVIAALAHNDRVRYAEPDGLTGAATTTPNDPYWSQEWGQSKVGVPSVWDTSTGDPSVVIAEIDSGVDYAHPDLQGRFVAGYDFVNNDASPVDDYGHGTKVAGEIGATSNNGVGVASYCWQCSIMPIKVLDSSGSGSYSNLINGITWATDHGARVINMSVVGSSDSSALRSAVQYAQANGVVLVGGAGNAGNSTPTYPASYPEVLSVAGSTGSDSLYSWSSYGSWVDVAAPGCTTTTVLGGSYGSFCGTSSATPAVAGIVGLLLSAQPAASSAQAITALESTAVPIGSQVAFGRVDADAALSDLAGDASTSPAPTPSPSTSPSPSPSPTATTSPVTTTSYSGSITAKGRSRSFSVATGSGELDATVSFAKGGPLSLDVDSAGATLASASGGSPVQVSAEVNAGTVTVVVSGTTRTSFTVTVTAPTP